MLEVSMELHARTNNIIIWMCVYEIIQYIHQQFMYICIGAWARVQKSLYLIVGWQKIWLMMANWFLDFRIFFFLLSLFQWILVSIVHCQTNLQSNFKLKRDTWIKIVHSTPNPYTPFSSINYFVTWQITKNVMSDNIGHCWTTPGILQVFEVQIFHIFCSIYWYCVMVYGSNSLTSFKNVLNFLRPHAEV